MYPERLIHADVVRKLQSLSEKLGVTRTELAIQYVKTKWPFAKIIFGAESLEQIAQNVSFNEKDASQSFAEAVEEEIGKVKEDIIDPRLWPKEE